MAEITFEESVNRVRKINNTLRDKGYNWEDIDKFWAGVFKICDALKNQEIEKVEIFKIKENGNDVHCNG